MINNGDLLTKNQSAQSNEQSKRLTKKEIAEQEFAKVDTIEKATKELPEFKPRTTFLVSDYTRFKNSEWNRKPAPNLKLKADLEKHGQLNPITVLVDKETGKITVINGGHRLHYIMELGLPVECIELPEYFKGTDFDAVKSLNIKSNGWITGAKGDFMGIYLKENNPNYVNFKRLTASSLNLSETIVHQQITGKVGNLKSMYENGDLVFDPTEEQELKLATLNKLMGEIISSRTEKDTKSYFDKPYIVKLINNFLDNNEGCKLHILEAALRKDGHALNRNSKVEDIEGYYQNFSIN